MGSLLGLGICFSVAIKAMSGGLVSYCSVAATSLLNSSLCTNAINTLLIP